MNNSELRKHNDSYSSLRILGFGFMVRDRDRVRDRVRARVNNENCYNVRLNRNELTDKRCLRQHSITYCLGFYQKFFMCLEGPRCDKFEEKLNVTTPVKRAEFGVCPCSS